MNRRVRFAAMTEQQIELSLIKKLCGLKYTIRPDIRDRATLDHNVRDMLQEFNRVALTDGEIKRLLVHIVTPNMIAAAHKLRNINRRASGAETSRSESAPISSKQLGRFA